MTKAELIAEMTKEGSINKDGAKKVVACFMEIISERLAQGEKVTINGFGTFQNVAVGERTRRNPKNGEPVFVPGYNTISFRSGKQLKDNLKK